MKIKYQLKVFYACRKYTQNRRHKMKTEIGEILRRHKMKTEIGEILKHSFEVFKEHFKDILGYSLEILKIFILLMK